LFRFPPNQSSIAKLFKSQVPIFEHFGIERQIKASFGRTVSMNRGAYLIVEHTEALHVIDVNSGNRSNKAKNQEDTANAANETFEFYLDAIYSRIIGTNSAS
jgi:ribonuclease G